MIQSLNKKDSLSSDVPPSDRTLSNLMTSEPERTPRDETEMDTKNATFDMFMAKGNSVRPLPKLTGMAETPLQPLDSQSGPSPRRSSPIRLPDDVIFHPGNTKMLSEFNRRSSRTPDPPSFVAVHPDRAERTPRGDRADPSPSLERKDSRTRESSSITNLKHFIYKFFRNESVFPIPSLTRHELGLLSSVLTRKYGKPINFR